MVRQTNSKEMIGRQGGEVNYTNQGAKVKNAQPGFTPGDATVPEIIEGISKGISGVKFQTAMGYFLSKGVPESLARAYGAALMDAATATGKDISDLVIQVNESQSINFTNDALASINIQRPRTAQIGYRVPGATSNNLIARTILA